MFSNGSNDVFTGGVVWDTNNDNRDKLEKIVLGGKVVDGIGDADAMSSAILGRDSSGNTLTGEDFGGLRKWQVGADQTGEYDDNAVVWEFGGKGWLRRC